MEEASAAILTVEQLAGRWGCSIDVVYDRVRTRGVPFVWLGRGEPRLSQAGRKHLVFRLADIEAWEDANVRVWPAPEARPAAPRPVGGAGRGLRALEEFSRMRLE